MSRSRGPPKKRPVAAKLSAAISREGDDGPAGGEGTSEGRGAGQGKGKGKGKGKSKEGAESNGPALAAAKKLDKAAASAAAASDRLRREVGAPKRKLEAEAAPSKPTKAKRK